MTGSFAAPLLRNLVGELKQDVEREIVITVKVAVCRAAKMPQAEMLEKLGITDVEAKMAVQRLSGIASRWSMG